MNTSGDASSGIQFCFFCVLVSAPIAAVAVAVWSSGRGEGGAPAPSAGGASAIGWESVVVGIEGLGVVGRAQRGAG